LERIREAHRRDHIMTALTTRGFHHITMVSTDAPRTWTFYRELLGLDLVKKTVNFDDPGGGAAGATGASEGSTTSPSASPRPKPS
jgi:catechol 2,3-dioxygenase-like lactoylglutathione lyase family enzyme